MDYYPNSYENNYKRTKGTPPLKEPPKELKPQTHGVESETLKGKENRTHQQEGAVTKSSGQGASTKPRPQKTRVRHAERVESILQQYHDEMAEQDDDEEEEGRGRGEDEEEEDRTDYPDVSERNEQLPRKRTFQDAELSHSDDSEFGALSAERNRRNVSYTIGQPPVKGTSSRPKRWPARDSDSEFDSGREGSEAPSLELGAGSEDPWQGPSKSSGKGK